MGISPKELRVNPQQKARTGSYHTKESETWVAVQKSVLLIFLKESSIKRI